MRKLLNITLIYTFNKINKNYIYIYIYIYEKELLILSRDLGRYLDDLKQ